jgi:dihydroorotate dehydrogenase
MHDLATTVLGVRLPLPVMNAPGLFGTPRELSFLLDSRTGAIVLPTATVHPFVHAQFRSLHNPGFDKLTPLVRQLVERADDRPVVASIAGGTADEYGHLARAFAEAGAALIEANLADPWVAATLAPYENRGALTAIAQVLAASPVPVLVRLAESAMRHYAAIADVLRTAGVRGVVARNEFKGFEKFLLEAAGDFDVVVVGNVASGYDVQRALTKGVKAVQVDGAPEGTRVFARLEHEMRLALGERSGSAG